MDLIMLAASDNGIPIPGCTFQVTSQDDAVTLPLNQGQFLSLGLLPPDMQGRKLKIQVTPDPRRHHKPLAALFTLQGSGNLVPDAGTPAEFVLSQGISKGADGLIGVVVNLPSATIPDAFTADEAKAIAASWDMVTTQDTGKERLTPAYFAWRKSALKVAAKVSALRDWMAKYEAHEKWALRGQGPEPTQPGPLPPQFTAVKYRARDPETAKYVDQVGGPPIPTYAVIQQYSVTLPGSAASYTFTDYPMDPSYEYLVNCVGVAAKGTVIALRKDIDGLFLRAGITNLSVQKVMKKVSTQEGGFEAVNTYDTGFVSVGFIQFTTGANALGTLVRVLRSMWANDPKDFAASFHAMGIDVDAKGLIVVDLNTGRTLRGTDAVQAIILDKRLTAIFYHAGKVSPAFQVAQLRVAHQDYYLADHTDPVFKVISGGATFSVTYSDVLRSEAGWTALMDRQVQRGNAPQRLKQACAAVLQKHPLTAPLTRQQDLANHLAKYERDIIGEPGDPLSLANRIPVLHQLDLTLPPVPPP